MKVKELDKNKQGERIFYYVYAENIIHGDDDIYSPHNNFEFDYKARYHEEYFVDLNKAKEFAIKNTKVGQVYVIQEVEVIMSELKLEENVFDIIERMDWEEVTAENYVEVKELYPQPKDWKVLSDNLNQVMMTMYALDDMLENFRPELVHDDETNNTYYLVECENCEEGEYYNVDEDLEIYYRYLAIATNLLHNIDTISVVVDGDTKPMEWCFSEETKESVKELRTLIIK